MSGAPVRVAVQVGAGSIRLAGAEADGEPWLVAQLPPGADVPGLLAELVGPPPDELVLVHPARWSPAMVGALASACAGVAGRVRAVPAPVAAASRVGRRAAVVLDVGAGGAEAAWCGPDGVVRACRTAAAGGRRLDALVLDRYAAGAADGASMREARRVREALSLLPAVDAGWGGGCRVTAEDLRALLAPVLAEAVRAVAGVLADVPASARPAPVLLVGGVARAPLLAELVDEAGIPDAVVVPRPDAAAVLGALTLPPGIGRGVPPRARGPAPPAARLLPPQPVRRRRPLRAALLAAAAACTAAGLLAVGSLLAPAPAAVPAGVLVQYGYRFDVPAGWEHTGGRPERRRVLLTPVAAPEGSDLIAVERSPLGYDAGAEPERAGAELRAGFDAAVAAGSAFSDYRPAERVAGRTVTRYVQRDGAARVEWHVVLDGDAQLSVGCRHTAANAGAVRAACAVVVGSVRRG